MPDTQEESAVVPKSIPWQERFWWIGIPIGIFLLWVFDRVTTSGNSNSLTGSPSRVTQSNVERIVHGKVKVNRYYFDGYQRRIKFSEDSAILESLSGGSWIEILDSIGIETNDDTMRVTFRIKEGAEISRTSHHYYADKSSFKLKPEYSSLTLIVEDGGFHLVERQSNSLPNSDIRWVLE